MRPRWLLLWCLWPWRLFIRLPMPSSAAYTTSRHNAVLVLDVPQAFDLSGPARIESHVLSALQTVRCGADAVSTAIITTMLWRLIGALKQKREKQTNMAQDPDYSRETGTGYGGIIGDTRDLVAFFNKHKDTLERILPLAEKALSFASRLIDALENSTLFKFLTGIAPK